jgi:hypothetical protein
LYLFSIPPADRLLIPAIVNPNGYELTANNQRTFLSKYMSFLLNILE